MKVEQVCPTKFIDVLSRKLKEEKKISVPAEAEYIKTGHGKEHAPESPDWYFVRTASILRKLYVEELKNPGRCKNGLGTLWFSRVYTTLKNNGHKPSHTVTGSKSLVRRILQTLEGANLVSQVPKGGRKLTAAGHQYLQEVAAGSE